MKNFKYYLAAVTAFSIWGFFSIVLKPLHDYPSLDILFYRVFSCAIIMTVISLLFKRDKLKENFKLFCMMPQRQRHTQTGLHIAASIFLTANWFSFIYVMNHVSVRATSVAYLVCPILTTILAYFILHERLNRFQWFAVLLSCAGCILLSYSSLTNMLYSTIIGLSYACYLITQRKNNGFDRFLVLNFHILLSALILIPFYPSFSGPLPVEFKFYFYVEVIAILYTIVPLLLNLYALSKINSSTVGMILNLNPIIAFVLSVVIYHESLNSIQLLAYLLIFTAVIVFSVLGKKPKTDKT